MNIVNNDRKYFTSSLLKNPLFLFRHLASLSHVVIRSINNKIKINLRSKHRGTKTNLKWVSLKPLFWSDQKNFHKLDLFLPSYPVLKKFDKAVDLEQSFEDLDDPEAYFELNRWGKLQKTLFIHPNNKLNNINMIVDWIVSHTDKNDDAWETYSACERISNLLVYLSVRANASEFVEQERRIYAFLIDSIEWVYQHLEYYGVDGTNNHILNNARALVVGCIAVDNVRGYQCGMKIFRDCLPIMVGRDGFLRERSSHYQLVVSNWLLDTWKFVDGQYGEKHADSIFLKEYSQRMVTAASLLCDKNGYLLGLIGDISPDITPEDSSLRLARLYPDFWPSLTKLKTKIPDGWFQVTDSNQFVLGNFSPDAFPPMFPTHSHNDYTSFIWSFNGIEILTDLGRYRYTPDEISLFQKSAFGHNIPLVNGFSPLCESILKNGLWWPKPYACATLESSISNDSLELKHNGFARATNVKEHTRKILLMKDGIEIIDSFDGDGKTDIQLLWNFGEKFKTFDGKLIPVVDTDDMVELQIKGFLESPFIYSNYGDPDGGWQSSSYGDVKPSLNIRVNGTVYLPAIISTRFKYKKCVV